METTYTKKDDHTITVEEVLAEKIIPETVLAKKEYTYSFLLKQKDDIQEQWDQQLEQKAMEIQEINERQGKEKAFVEKLILEAEKLGIIRQNDSTLINTELP